MGDVILVEDVPGAAAGPDDPGRILAADAGTPDGHGPRRVGWTRRWRWAVLGLTIVVVGSAAVADRRAAIVAFAAVPGVLAPVAGPFSERWRVPDAQFSDLAGVGGLIAGVASNVDGSVDVVALEPATGHVQWRVATRSPGGPGAAQGVVGTTCSYPDPRHTLGVVSAATVIACVVTDQYAPVTMDGGASVIMPSVAHQITIDATTGTVLANRPVAAGASVVVAGDDLLTGWLDAAGLVHVTRMSARTGHASWAFQSAAPVGVDALTITAVRLSATNDTITVDTVALVYMASIDPAIATGASWLLSGDGNIRRELPTGLAATGSAAGIRSLGPGIVAETGAAGGRADVTTFTDTRTGRSFEVPGIPFDAFPNDGTAAGSVLLESATSGALSANSGTSSESLWTAPHDKNSPSIVLQGRLIATTSGNIAATDARTGQPIWQVPAAHGDPTALLTDGHLVILAIHEPGGTLTITAYDLDDGVQRWTTPLPGETVLTPIGGRVYATSTQGLVALT